MGEFDDDPEVVQVEALVDPNLPPTTANDLRNPIVKASPSGTGQSRKTREQLLYLDETDRKRQHYVSQSALSQATQTADVATKLALIQKAMAEEIATLQFNRRQQDLNGTASVNTSGKILAGLQELADLEIKAKTLGVQNIDLASPKIQKMLTIWVEIIQEVAASVFPPEQCDVFITKLTSAMEGWEQRVEAELR